MLQCHSRRSPLQCSVATGTEVVKKIQLESGRGNKLNSFENTYRYTAGAENKLQDIKVHVHATSLDGVNVNVFNVRRAHDQSRMTQSDGVNGNGIARREWSARNRASTTRVHKSQPTHNPPDRIGFRTFCTVMSQVNYIHRNSNLYDKHNKADTLLTPRKNLNIRKAR